MKILKKLTINSPIAKVWDVLGNQFEHIDRWSSLIEKSEVSGDPKLPGVHFSVRSTLTTAGPTQQELVSFNPAQHSLSYKAIAGTPFFFKSVNAKWSLTKDTDERTNLELDFEVKFKRLIHAAFSLSKTKIRKSWRRLIRRL